MDSHSTAAPTRALSLAEQRLLAELPEIVGLEPNETLWVGGIRDAVALVTSPPTLTAALFLMPGMRVETANRREAIERLAYGTLQQLAISRTWRHLRTDGPPWSVFTGNAMWDALVNADIVGPQKLIDVIKRTVANEGVDPTDPRAPWTSWRTVGSIPTALEGVRGVGAGHHLPRAKDGPWLSGCYHEDQIVVLAYGNGDGFAVRPVKTIKREGRSSIVYEIRTAAKIPETILTAAVGRPVAQVVDEKLVRELGGKIVACDTKVRTTRLRVQTDWPQQAGMPVEHAFALASQLDRVMWRVQAVADEVERSLLGQ